jgi:hypothetical protein
MEFIDFIFTRNTEIKESYFRTRNYVDGLIRIDAIFSEKRYSELNLSADKNVIHYNELIQKKGFRMLKKDRSYYTCINAKTLLSKIEKQIKK